MEPRVSLLTLGVADLEHARAFYEGVLGWTPAESPPGIVFFDLGGLIFSLYPHKELIADYGGKSTGTASQGFALAHNLRSIAEVDALFAQLKQRGATIIKMPEKVFWGGYSGYFQDPDGHKWEVAFNPFWTIREDGRIVMQPPEGSP